TSTGRNTSSVGMVGLYDPPETEHTATSIARITKRILDLSRANVLAPTFRRFKVWGSRTAGEL
ncbi:hypothetical protein, partial [Bradyrhizobium sp. 23AC]